MDVSKYRLAQLVVALDALHYLRGNALRKRFFLKKEAKTFATCLVWGISHIPDWHKGFDSFFQKRICFLSSCA
jgi:hypothetical protein